LIDVKVGFPLTVPNEDFPLTVPLILRRQPKAEDCAATFTI
jgi:hypothetical protein